MNKIKFEIEIDPQPILDNLYSYGDPSRGLSEAIEKELRKQAIDRFANEIRSEVSDSRLDWFTTLVRDEIINKTQKQINQIIDNRFNERGLERFIEFQVEKVMNEWIEKKVTDRLEAVKADILFVTTRDMEEMDNEHQRELDEAYNSHD